MSLNGLARLAPPALALEEFGSFPAFGRLPAWVRRLLGLPMQGRITPDQQLQGPPKRAPRPVRPLRPEPPAGYGPFRCGFCGRYGAPGACAGCGAPNEPASQAEPATQARRLDTILRSHELPCFPPNRVVRG